MSENHTEYIMNKEKTTIKLWNDQMVNGRIFGKTPFDKVNDLKESIEDFEEKKEKTND